MRIIGFVGSPRKDGNTHRLVNAVLDGAAQRGASTWIYHLAGMAMGGCTSCFYCRTHTRCVLKDDMAPVYDDLFNADAVIIGSPVFMWQMSGQTKLFVDRLYPVMNPDFTSRLTKKPKLVLAFTQGQPDVDTFRPYFENTAKILGFLGFNVIRTLVAGGTRALGDVEKNTDIMARAQATGAELVP